MPIDCAFSFVYYSFSPIVPIMLLVNPSFIKHLHFSHFYIESIVGGWKTIRDKVGEYLCDRLIIVYMTLETIYKIIHHSTIILVR